MQQRSFEFGDDTEVFLSCSLQWKNQYYVFGGLNEKTQVSMVIDFRLERKGRLAFNFDIGGCTVLEQLIIVLCFTDKEGKLCRQSKTPLGQFTNLPNSNYKHQGTRFASFNGRN